jgi:hypothetical protein
VGTLTYECMHVKDAPMFFDCGVVRWFVFRLGQEQTFEWLPQLQVQCMFVAVCVTIPKGVDPIDFDCDRGDACAY